MIIKIASTFAVFSLTLLGMMPSIVVASARDSCVPRCAPGIPTPCINTQSSVTGKAICVKDGAVGNTQKWRPACKNGSVRSCPDNGGPPNCDGCPKQVAFRKNPH
ncbi:uncharacterized protein MELLADRAFT_108910 [Melampsora larici-populina 98AG31]|uniref:Secreted protein n=1 Tax=Melampsora larici-populina (strain 98AG31 / pathotype 3-4-7) TaxID=747676 RepID=F4RUQ6_MELLP|nr:uncharacterized protein MELLADRAFT_108910 [Melampsora larici-populina 98AG31]EGG03739.1 secreted protein [Melampsora larici-populina 98AG31]